MMLFRLVCLWVLLVSRDGREDKDVKLRWRRIQLEGEKADGARERS